MKKTIMLKIYDYMKRLCCFVFTKIFSTELNNIPSKIKKIISAGPLFWFFFTCIWTYCFLVAFVLTCSWLLGIDITEIEHSSLSKYDFGDFLKSYSSVNDSLRELIDRLSCRLNGETWTPEISKAKRYTYYQDQEISDLPTFTDTTKSSEGEESKKEDQVSFVGFALAVLLIVLSL